MRFEDGGRGHKLQNVGDPGGWKSKETHPLVEPPEETNPAGT